MKSLLVGLMYPIVAGILFGFAHFLVSLLRRWYYSRTAKAARDSVVRQSRLRRLPKLLANQKRSQLRRVL